MTKYYQTNKFKDLNKKWTKKLKNSGFDDIEQADGFLKEWSASKFKANYDPILLKAKELYYRMAGQFLHEHSFKNELENTIWKLHCDGKSLVEIDKDLRQIPGKARRVIDKLKVIMRDNFSSEEELDQQDENE